MQRRPVLFFQSRIGTNGTVFNIIKLRTLPNTPPEQKLKEISAHLEENAEYLLDIENQEQSPLTMRFIRRFAIDELPQLINIMKGEMSFVGPRPTWVLEGEQEILSEKIRPGITGLWQVSSYNNKKKKSHKQRLDKYYIKNWSPWFDIVIVLKTIPAIIRNR